MKIFWFIISFLFMWHAAPPVSEADAGVPQVVTAESAQGKYEWSRFTDTQAILTKDGEVIGQWYFPDGQYYPWDGKKNLATCKPPIDPPGRGIRPGAKNNEFEKWQTAGVHGRQDRDRTSYSGRQISHDKIQDAFNGKLEDDSAKGYFVIIAKNQTDRERVLADWHKLPSDFTSRFNVWMAPPDHFSMWDRFNNKPRFFTEGDPTVELMAADGTVLFRRPQGGVYHSTDMQDLLKSDPSYNPKLDPGAPEVSTFHLHIPVRYAIAGALVLLGLVLIVGRKVL